MGSGLNADGSYGEWRYAIAHHPNDIPQQVKGASG